MFLGRRCLARGIFDARRLERALDRYERGPALLRAHSTPQLWAWITLELWFQQFVD